MQWKSSLPSILGPLVFFLRGNHVEWFLVYCQKWFLYMYKDASLCEFYKIITDIVYICKWTQRDACNTHSYANVLNLFLIYMFTPFDVQFCEFDKCIEPCKQHKVQNNSTTFFPKNIPPCYLLWSNPPSTFNF